MKYHVMFNHREPSENESSRWQNFDQLIHDYQAVRSQRLRRRRWFYGSLLMLGLALVGGSIVQYFRTAAPLPLLQPIASIPPTTNTPSLSTVLPEPPAPITVPKQNTTRSPQQPTSLPPAASADAGSFVEASPKGGYPALYDYFAQQVQYPEAARSEGREGTVLLEFMIDTTGQAHDIRLMQGLSADLNQEAIRLVQEMPRWSPATVNGQPISTKHIMPLSFTLTRP